MGAMALFGEKYGDKVRVVKFGDSVELCGGTHTSATGNIGYFKIVSEGATAAGVRRIEAITGKAVEERIEVMEDTLQNARALLNDHPDLVASLQRLLRENEALSKEMEQNMRERAVTLKTSLWEQRKDLNGIQFVSLRGTFLPEMVKDLAFMFRNEGYDHTVFAAAYEANGKPNLTLMISQDLADAGMNAGTIIRQAARHIQGGGGGQNFFATAGGKDTDGLQAAMDEMTKAVKNI
jgi:alanyl-tRNA synthetase